MVFKVHENYAPFSNRITLPSKLDYNMTDTSREINNGITVKVSLHPDKIHNIVPIIKVTLSFYSFSLFFTPLFSFLTSLSPFFKFFSIFFRFFHLFYLLFSFFPLFTFFSYLILNTFFSVTTRAHTHTHIYIYIQTKELVNTMLLSGRPTRYPMSVYSVTHPDVIKDITNQSNCTSLEESVAKVVCVMTLKIPQTTFKK